MHRIILLYNLAPLSFDGEKGDARVQLTGFDLAKLPNVCETSRFADGSRMGAVQLHGIRFYGDML